MSNKRLKFLVAILVILIIIFIYFYYFSGRDSGSSDNVVAVSGSGVGVMQGIEDSSDSEGKQIVETLGVLKMMQMDTSFFENEKFKSLLDNSVELIPEPAGRVNPFAPL
ncbi:hypothetical protein KJ763_00540 [Patescibacteria group bacterium]|nr:hypothetical protein [Patescibacteria group bacterium]